MPKVFEPREWQERFVRAYQTNSKKNFLLEACISAGKTAGSLYAYVSMRKFREWRFLVVVVPAEHLMRQYAQDAFKLFGLNLHYSGTDKRLGRVPIPSELIKAGFHSLVISYQWLTKPGNAEFLAKAIENSFLTFSFRVNWVTARPNAYL
jgi:superfamily II DNA or RNA helicase